MPTTPSPFPQLPTPIAVMAQMQQLLPQAADNIPDQHMVSQVIQRRFTEPYGKQGDLFLARLSLKYSNSRPVTGSPRRFGKYPDFVKFASRSMEAVWKQTEDRLHDTLNAAQQGTAIGDPGHEAVLREAIVLHCVRSIPALAQQLQTWTTTRERQRQQWRPYRAQLEQLFYWHRGYYAAERGWEALDLFLNELVEDLTDLQQQGALFRVMLEDRFARYKQGLSGHQVQIVVPSVGEFLFGDVPALVVGWNGNRIRPAGEIGLANADEIVLPVTPYHLAVLRLQAGPTVIGQDVVDEYNAAQVRAAREYVHFRPNSVLEGFVRSVLASKP
jgi:hypothetical protein